MATVPSTVFPLRWARQGHFLLNVPEPCLTKPLYRQGPHSNSGFILTFCQLRTGIASIRACYCYRLHQQCRIRSTLSLSTLPIALLKILEHLKFEIYWKLWDTWGLSSQNILKSIILTSQSIWDPRASSRFPQSSNKLKLSSIRYHNCWQF